MLYGSGFVIPLVRHRLRRWNYCSTVRAILWWHNAITRRQTVPTVLYVNNYSLSCQFLCCYFFLYGICDFIWTRPSSALVSNSIWIFCEINKNIRFPESCFSRGFDSPRRSMTYLMGVNNWNYRNLRLFFTCI